MWLLWVTKFREDGYKRRSCYGDNQPLLTMGHPTPTCTACQPASQPERLPCLPCLPKKIAAPLVLITYYTSWKTATGGGGATSGGRLTSPPRKAPSTNGCTKKKYRSSFIPLLRIKALRHIIFYLHDRSSFWSSIDRLWWSSSASAPSWRAES